MAIESQQKQKFASPREEVEWLEKRLREKKSEMEKGGEIAKEQKEVISEIIKEHSQKPAEQVLAPAYRLPEKEAGTIILKLKPEQHDRQIEELLGVLEEKGILNAVSVAKKLGAHIEDDFHRVLVQYLMGKIGDPGWSKSKDRLFRSLKMALYEVTLPQDQPGKDSQQIGAQPGNSPFAGLISAMEQFYGGMAAIAEKEKFSLFSKQASYFALELALPVIGEEISFYVSVPADKSGIFEKQLLAVFPKAQIKPKQDDYNIFQFGGVSMAATAELKTSSILPIKTYDKLSVDPLEIISNAFSKLDKDGEGAALQLVIAPIKNSIPQRIKNIISRLRKGEPLSKAMKGDDSLPKELVKAFIDLFFGGGASKKQEENKPKPIDEEVIKLLESKASRMSMLANVRLVVSGKTKEEAAGHLNEIKSAFLQFSEPSGNSVAFKDLEGKSLDKFIYNFSFRIFDADDAIYLNTAELTSIYHFPIGRLSTPKIKYLKAKDAPPPPNLPVEGSLLGKNVYRDEEVDIFIKPDDRRRHLYVIGQTGTGKSVLIKNMAAQDIEKGNGVCVIDPHGEAVADILARVPKERLEDVVYFDPSDTSRPMGLNMLEYDPNFPEQKTFVVNELFSIFKKLYGAVPESMGPAFEQYFRNSAMLVMDHPESGSTLLEIGRVLADKEFRALKMSHCKNPLIVQFWQSAEETTGEQSLANFVPYITNKFDVFLQNEIMRPIVAQEKSSFNFREIMDSRKIFLVNLSKGRLGDLNSNLIGLIIVGKILMAALSRVDLPETERNDFYLYIDEFQNVTTKSISTILSEARKYRLDLIIAHQFIGQLEEDIKKAVFGNVGSMAIFRVGVDDSQVLEKQVEPTFNAYDLINIDNYNAYLRLLVDGQTARPFNIKTIPFEKGNAETAEAAKQLSSLKYGRPRETVEEEILGRYRQQEPKI